MSKKEDARPARAAQATTSPADADVRCPCGGLVARRVGDAVEIKCRRCRRVVLVPLEQEEGA